MTENLRSIAEVIRRANTGGDTVLAHISPREADMLKASGGSGRINPDTGLPSFEGGQEDRIFNFPAGYENTIYTQGFTLDPTVSGSGMEGSRRYTQNAAPAPAPSAPTAPRPAAPVAAAAGPPAALPPQASPVAQAIMGAIGAINRSSGDTGSSALNAAAVARAGRAGTSREDLVYSVDNSRQRSQSQGIVGPRPLGMPATARV
jgi:hypothetical protein